MIEIVLYTRNQTAELLHISTRTLDRYRENGLIRAHSAGKGCKVSYSESEIIACLNRMAKLGGKVV